VPERFAQAAVMNRATESTHPQSNDDVTIVRLLHADFEIGGP
jgi:hypothetical protein